MNNMDIDKIIGAMRVKRNSKIIKQDFSRGGYSKREMLAGYSMAVKDLSDLITQQTPPCTGSSVHKSEHDKLHDYCETLNNFNKTVDEKNKRFNNCFTYDINIGDEVKLKDEQLEKLTITEDYINMMNMNGIL